MANPMWTPATLVAYGTVIVDPNGNVQQATTVNAQTSARSSGTTGASLPAFATVRGQATADNTVTWTCVAAFAAPTQLPSSLNGLALPNFISDADGLDPNAILNSVVAAFESATGRTLYPAQLEQLLLNILAYRDALAREIIQYAGQQCLVAFADYPMIDYLAQNVGVTRLAAVGATANILITIAAQVVDITIPQGYRVGTTDGAFVFATNRQVTIVAGQRAAVVAATCTTPGTIGNGYDSPKIAVPLTANGLVVSAVNIDTSHDGSDGEITEQLRARVQLAPNSFSVAGPGPSYEFFARSASPAIADVQVSQPSPGSVLVTILPSPVPAQPGPTPTHDVLNPQGVIDAVQLVLDPRSIDPLNAPDSVRPLTDTVAVQGVQDAGIITYDVVATVTVLSTVDASSVRGALTTAAQAFAQQVGARLQNDIVPEEWVVALGKIGGVYRVVLTDPTRPSYVQLTPGQWAHCRSITITMVDYTQHPIGSNITLP